jgi:glycosyltransferase involved in cell wall biosynthesis
MTTAANLSISVVIPAFDAAPYLADALESVQRQDRAADEVLVVDDASTDGSAAVAGGFPGVEVIRHDANLGASAARNTGILRARGRLVAFLDADDLWRPSKLRRQADHLFRHPGLGYSVTMMQDFLEPGVERPRWLKPTALVQPTVGLGTSALMVRREVFDVVGMFDPRLEVHEDTDWFARCDRAGIARGVVDHVLLDRRVHAENLSHRTPTRTADLPRFLKERLDRHRSLDMH